MRHLTEGRVWSMQDVNRSIRDLETALAQARTQRWTIAAPGAPEQSELERRLLRRQVISMQNDLELLVQLRRELVLEAASLHLPRNDDAPRGFLELVRAGPC